MATNADYSAQVNELSRLVESERRAGRISAAKAREAEQHAKDADVIIRGAFAVLRQFEFHPGPGEELQDVIARALKARVNPTIEIKR
jgi:hypothetical protein